MIISSTYQSGFPLNNPHLETVIPYFLRPMEDLDYQRERIETQDDDFLDLDWIKQGHQKLVVLSHGLEGCSRSKYIQGVGRTLMNQGFDILAWNNRSCSGEMNRQIKAYHSGASYDLREVMNHVFHNTRYPEIYLVGFSMGGNITLKYLGEEASNVNSRIKRALVFSTPVSLADSADALSRGVSKVYSRHFIRRIIKKMRLKEQMFPEFNIDLDRLQKTWSFEVLDDAVTAPLNGFKDARDYWNKASSMHFIPEIKIPSLIVNALNDPFLADRCYPYDLVRNHNFVDLETPERGGHVSFVKEGFFKDFWYEQKVLEYLTR